MCTCVHVCVRGYMAGGSELNSAGLFVDMLVITKHIRHDISVITFQFINDTKRHSTSKNLRGIDKQKKALNCWVPFVCLLGASSVPPGDSLCLLGASRVLLGAFW